MRGIVRYYGGKTRMASKIIKHIDRIPHLVYAEPFAGGAAVLFAKPIYDVKNYREVINDKNEDIITMYRVAQTKKEEFIHRIENTPYSHAEYKRAKYILNNKEEFEDIDIAWAIVVGISQAFAHKLLGGWRFSRKGDPFLPTWNKYRYNIPAILERFHQVIIDCDDAINFINRWDSERTLFYLDPPYPETTQNYKDKYTIENWMQLCDRLDTIKGSYILSGYYQDYAPKTYTSVEQYAAKMSGTLTKDRVGKDDRVEYLWIKNNIMPDVVKEVKNEVSSSPISEYDRVETKITKN